MYIVKCDRCGNEDVVKDFFRPWNMADCKPPKYSIIMATKDGTVPLNLCEGCTKDFDDFLGLEDDDDESD